jgi:VWFA-related protein
MGLAKHFVVLTLVAHGAAGGAAFQMAGLPGDSPRQQATTQQQRPGARGTYRVQVRLVPVDVIVTDAKSRPVTDLKKEDFRLFENGRLQEIRHFSLQALAPAAAQPESPLRSVPALDLSPQTSRTFLIIMGRGRIQRPFHAVDEAIQFVRKSLLPQDRVAVFAYNRATRFTTDHEEVAQVLERYKAIHDRLESLLELRMSGLAAIYGSKEIPPSFQAQIDRIFAAPNAISHRLPSAPLGDATTMNRDALKVMEQALISAESPSRSEFTQIDSDTITDLPFEEYAATFAATSQDMQNIYTCIRYMRLMEGEKHLLFFTQDGLFLSRLEYESSLAAIANDARVMIHTFQTGGLPVLPSFSRTFAVSSLRNVSGLTGGQAAVHEDIGTALARVNETTRAEYLLGYYPQDENWNGKYRKIDVKVSRPGVKVSFRHGYYARETLPPSNREEFVALDRIRAAASYTQDLSDVGFSIRTSPGMDPLGPPEIKIDFQVEPGRVGLKIVDGCYTGKLYAAVFSADAKGKYLGENRGIVDISFPQAQYPEIAQSGITFSVLVPLATPGQILKVVVYDVASGRIGSKLHKMQK